MKLEQSWRRRIGLGALLLVGVLAVSAGRQLVVGAHASEDAERLLAADDAEDKAGAIFAARRAAEARLPGSPYPEKGYTLLERIAREAEARGDDETSNMAWRAVRAAALETRAAGGSSAERWLARANEGLTRVGSRASAGAESVKTANDIRPSERELTERLDRDDTPSSWTFVVLAAAVLAFFAGAGRLAWLAGRVGSGALAGKLTWGTARAPALVAIAGLLVWLFVALR